MNTSGMLRAYLAKVMDVESFFFHVMNCMEKQFIDWHMDALLLFSWEEQNDQITGTFLIEGFAYSFSVSKTEISELQSASPYALDKKMWETLAQEGFAFKKSHYIDKLFL